MSNFYAIFVKAESFLYVFSSEKYCGFGTLHMLNDSGFVTMIPNAGAWYSNLLRRNFLYVLLFLILVIGEL